MAADPGPRWALEHYARGLEDGRLDSPMGRLERERTQELLQRHLPPPPATVADIGGGTGAYSLWLAARGYEVVHRDLVPLHVEQLRTAAEDEAVQIDAAVGDARDLDLPNASADAVLLLGPLYHLRERDGRVRCLSEAARVTRPSGTVVAAAISRWAALLDVVLAKRYGEGDPAFGAVLDGALGTGMLEPLEAGGFSAYCHRPEELRAEAEDAGLRELRLVQVEGPGAYLPDLAARWSEPAARAAILGVSRRTEDVPELLGTGPHLLLIGRSAAS
jgi:SAM-dependent methyltransferase